MNKNKIIFAIIGGIVLLLIIGLFMILSSAGTPKKKGDKSAFHIWILHDDSRNFSQFLDAFKTQNNQYKDINFAITSFDSYEDYYYALLGAFMRDEGPDMYVVNNGDNDILLQKAVGVHPSIVAPDNFKRNYELVFSQDLISSYTEKGKQVEYLRGIPLGYETLGIFYNSRYSDDSELSTWDSVEKFIRSVDTRAGVGIGIGDGSSVYMSEDIITQFILLDGIETLKGITTKDFQSAFANYTKFADNHGTNKYANIAQKYLNKNQTNLDAFSSSDVQAIIGYPRILQEIEKRGYNKTLLRGDPFPMYSKNSGKLLINYNYFVINEDTIHRGIADDLMGYFASFEGQQKYLEIFPYYFPSMTPLKEVFYDEKLNESFDVKHKDLMNSSLDLTTFDRGIKNIYDTQIINIADSQGNGGVLFEKMQKKVICMSQKMVEGQSLSQKCN